MSREKIKINKECSTSLNFLYKTVLGRSALKVLTRPSVSKFGGWVLSRKFSRLYINKFIKNNGIDMDDYPKRKYLSFNDFFTRNIIPEKRPVADDGLISPCDGYLTAYKIDYKSRFFIKGRTYSLDEILKNNEYAEEFHNGICLIFRLTVKDYHHYCYIEDGEKVYSEFLNGILHTVQPIACADNDIYKENAREYVLIESDKIGRFIQMEVGALMVGKINNNDSLCIRGTEKGKFEFGGSTIVVLLKDVARIDDEIWENTRNGFETKVKYSEKIGDYIYLTDDSHNINDSVSF